MTKPPQAESIGPETHPPFIHSLSESAKQWERKSPPSAPCGAVDSSGVRDPSPPGLSQEEGGAEGSLKDRPDGARGRQDLPRRCLTPCQRRSAAGSGVVVVLPDADWRVPTGTCKEPMASAKRPLRTPSGDAPRTEATDIRSQRVTNPLTAAQRLPAGRCGASPTTALPAIRIDLDNLRASTIAAAATVNALSQNSVRRVCQAATSACSLSVKIM